MKKQISPAMTGVLITVVVLALGFAIWHFAGGNQGEQRSGMPADVAADFQKRMHGAPGIHLPAGGNAAARPAAP